MSLRDALQEKRPDLLYLINAPSDGSSPVKAMAWGMREIYKALSLPVPEIRNPVLMAKDLEEKVRANHSV